MDGYRVADLFLLSVKHGRRPARTDQRPTGAQRVDRRYAFVRAQHPVACFTERGGHGATRVAEVEQWRTVGADIHACSRECRRTRCPAILADAVCRAAPGRTAAHTYL